MLSKTKKLSLEFPKTAQKPPNFGKKEFKKTKKALSAILTCARTLEILGPTRSKRFSRQIVDLVISTIKTPVLSQSEQVKTLFLNVLSVLVNSDFFDPLIVDAIAFLIYQEQNVEILGDRDRKKRFFVKGWNMIGKVVDNDRFGSVKNVFLIKIYPFLIYFS